MYGVLSSVVWSVSRCGAGVFDFSWCFLGVFLVAWALVLTVAGPGPFVWGWILFSNASNILEYFDSLCVVFSLLLVLLGQV